VALAADGSAVWAAMGEVCGLAGVAAADVPCLSEDYAHEVARFGCAQVMDTGSFKKKIVYTTHA
jgi:hypothetical protein